MSTGASVEIIGADRTPEVTDAAGTPTFADDFADWTVHLYRIE